MLLHGAFKSEFTRNSAILVSGTVISQVIPLVFSPILSRLYNTADFALFGLFYSTVGLIASISAGTYEYSIILPKSESNAKSLLVLSIFISLIISVLFFVLSCFFNTTICVLLKNKQISGWLYIVPISSFVFSCYSIFNMWYSRKKKFTKISVNKIVRNGTVTSSSFLFGIMKIQNAGLIVGQILGDIIAMVILAIKILQKDSITKDVSRKNLIRVAIEYRKFPIYTLPATLLSNLANLLPIYLISSLFNSNLTGAYFFSVRILSVPAALIGAAIGQVFMQKFSDIVNFRPHEAKKILIKVWTALFIIGLLPYSVLCIYGSYIFTFIFGSQWTSAGEITTIIAPMLLFMLVSSPTSSAYIVLGKQRLIVYFALFSFVYRLAALLTGYYFKNFYIGLIILSAFEIGNIVIYNAILLKLLKDSDYI